SPRRAGVHHAVDDDRRGFLAVRGGEIVFPREAEPVGIVGVDLRERRMVGLRGVVAAGQPTRIDRLRGRSVRPRTSLFRTGGREHDGQGRQGQSSPGCMSHESLPPRMMREKYYAMWRTAASEIVTKTCEFVTIAAAAVAQAGRLRVSLGECPK